MKLSLTLMAGIGALAAVPPLFFIHWIMRKKNADYDLSHLIDGTVVELDFFGHRGKAYPIVEYSSGGKIVRFNNHAHVPGAQIGDTVPIEIGADQKARVFSNINAKMQQIAGSYTVLCLIIGIGALGWHFLKL